MSEQALNRARAVQSGRAAAYLYLAGLNVTNGIISAEALGAASEGAE